MGDKRSSSFDRDKSDEERRLAALAKSQAINGLPAGSQESQVQPGVDAATTAAMAQIVADEKQKREQQTAEELQQTLRNIQQKVGGLPTSGVSSTEGANGTVGGTNDAGGVENGTTGGIPVDNSVSTAIEEANKKIAGATEESIKATQQNNEKYRNFLGKLVEGYQNDLEQAKKEAELQKQIDTNKSVFAGVTEFASALVNLLGTTKGAVNQQPKTYTQDWMREADAHRQQERERLDRMRDKLRDQEMKNENARYQMTKEQIAEHFNLMKLQAQGGVAVEQQRKAERDEAYERERAAVSDQLAADRIEAQIRGQNVEMSRIAQRDRQDATKLQIEMLKQGMIPDSNGNYIYDPAAAAKKMGAYALEIPAYGDRQTEMLYIQPTSVKNTILSYARNPEVIKEMEKAGLGKEFTALVTQMKGSEGDMFAKGTLSGTDVENQIRTMAMYSPTLREALRRSAVHSYDVGAAPEQTSAAQQLPAWAQGGYNPYIHPYAPLQQMRDREDKDDWPTEEELSR